MKQPELISIDEFCIYYKVEISFLNALKDFGLVEIIVIEESKFIGFDSLRELEKIIHLYYELGINLEGIEVIVHLLSRVKDMQSRISSLENRLRMFDELDK